MPRLTDRIDPATPRARMTDLSFEAEVGAQVS
jgi:hypothetical protein